MLLASIMTGKGSRGAPDWDGKIGTAKLGRQDKSADGGRAHVVGRIDVFLHHDRRPCRRLRGKGE